MAERDGGHALRMPCPFSRNVQRSLYYAVQNIVAMFNDAVRRAPDYVMAVECKKELSWYAFQDKKTGLDLVTFWDGTAVPGNDFSTVKATLRVKHGRFQEPVWVDLLTGSVYAIPSEKLAVDGSAFTFCEIPVYDGPVVITDKSLLTLEPAREKKK